MDFCISQKTNSSLGGWFFNTNYKRETVVREREKSVGRAVGKNLDFLPLRQFDKVSSFRVAVSLKRKKNTTRSHVPADISPAANSKQGSLVISIAQGWMENVLLPPRQGKVNPELVLSPAL